jgi:hypothetical protein
MPPSTPRGRGHRDARHRPTAFGGQGLLLGQQARLTPSAVESASRRGTSRWRRDDHIGVVHRCCSTPPPDDHHGAHCWCWRGSASTAVRCERDNDHRQPERGRETGAGWSVREGVDGPRTGDQREAHAHRSPGPGVLQEADQDPVEPVRLVLVDQVARVRASRDGGARGVSRAPGQQSAILARHADRHQGPGSPEARRPGTAHGRRARRQGADPAAATERRSRRRRRSTPLPSRRGGSHAAPRLYAAVPRSQRSPGRRSRRSTTIRAPGRPWSRSMRGPDGR